VFFTLLYGESSSITDGWAVNRPLAAIPLIDKRFGLQQSFEGGKTTSIGGFYAFLMLRRKHSSSIHSEGVAGN
jgi:hypothetical protein